MFFKFEILGWEKSIYFMLTALTFDPVCVQMQGAGAKSWNRLSSIFNKEDEHQLLEETESPPVPDQWVKMFNSRFLSGWLLLLYLVTPVCFVKIKLKQMILI